MLYLSPLSGDLMKIRHPLLGCMRTPENNRGVPPGMSWAGDCGLKVATSTDPAEIDRYLGWLGSLDRTGCLFAVTPDVLGDAAACWRRSAPLLPRIRALGYRAAFVAQDGFDGAAIDWDAFDVLFIGGRPGHTRAMTPNERKRLAGLEWKRSESGGYAAIADGKQHGKWVHVGRVNGGPFLRNLAAAGADSADGTNLTWNNLRARTLGWLDGLIEQPPMGLFADSTTAPPTASSSASPESAESLAIHEEGGRLTGGPVGRQTRSDELRGRPCGIIAARALPTTSRATTRR